MIMKSRIKNNNIDSMQKKVIKNIRRTKIKHRLIFSFFVLLFISIILISTLVYTLLKGSIKSKTTIYSENIIQQISFNINNKLAAVENIYDEVYENGTINDLEKLNNANSIKEKLFLRNEISSLNRQTITINKEVKSLVIIDKNKQEIQTGSLTFNNNKDILDKFINGDQFKWIYYIETGAKSSDGHFILFKSLISKTSKEYLGTMIIEYDKNAFSDFYNNIDLGNGSKIFTMDSYGNILDNNIEENYASESFIKKINDNEKNSEDIKEIQVNIAGDNKLILYSKIPNTDFYNIASIPVSNFNKEPNSILFYMILIGIISIVISMIVANIVGKSITKPLILFVKNLRVSGQGDLTYRSKESFKDEIGEININFGGMLENISKLIIEVKELSENVNVNTIKIEDSIKQTSIASEQIAVTMEEISKGTKEQSDEIVSGISIMEDLEKEINNSTNKMTETSQIIDNSKMAIEGSVETIKALNDKSEETHEFSKEIIKEINDLNNDMKEIKEITDLIMSISGETNLLSLNAEIEASKAGEAGKAFSVVADEVRSLAIQSKNASININNIINEILIKTEYAVKETKDLTNAVNNQIEAVEKTNNTFKDISECMNSISEKIEKMKELVENILKFKELAMNTIVKIATISEEALSTTKSVSSSTEEQIAGVQELAEFIMLLTQMSRKLNTSVEKFVLE